MSGRQRILAYLAAIAVVVGVGNFFLTFALAPDPKHLSAADRTRLVGLFFVAMAGMAYLAFTSMGAVMRGKVSSEVAAQRAYAVRMSGPLLATSNKAGGIAGLNSSGGLLRVSVYPGGILVKPFLMEEQAILPSEISDIRDERRFLQRRLVVEHDGIGIASPLELFGALESPMRMAILRLAPAPGTRMPIPAPRPSRLAWLMGPNSNDRVLKALPGGVRFLLAVMGTCMAVLFVGFGLAMVLGPESPTSVRVFGLAWTGGAVLIGISSLAGLWRSFRD